MTPAPDAPIEDYGQASAAIDRAWARVRAADVALDPAEMGTARYTRHSFARSFLRVAARQRWSVRRAHWDVDAAGRGEVVYRVDANGHVFLFVAFSTALAEAQRTDRVIAEAWDVTGALIEGDLTPERWATLRREVPRQEAGRADAGTLVWTRANRSARYFDYVVEQLAAGRQPDPDAMGDTPYVLRSTAFYGNGKFGMADFDQIPPGHPLQVPYRSQMLTAWLVRELSYDLVEHCARVQNPDAAVLTGAWRRCLGLGNATGLGMVPYIINHPRVLNAWCAMRELPLAHALSNDAPDQPDLTRVTELLHRAIEYFVERETLPTAPFLGCRELSDQLRQILALVEEYAAVGTVAGTRPPRVWQTIWDTAQSIGPAARAVLDTILVEISSDLDTEIEQLLRCDETTALRPRMTCAALQDILAQRYDWVRAYDFTEPAEQHFFWFTSQDNEEPRRGRRGVDPGESVEHPLAIACDVTELWADLHRIDPSSSVAEFLLSHPWHRGVVGRVQTLDDVPYGEVRTNLLGRDFLPLNLQRFQLAAYGMESYSPQSTDWLRVALYSGAPRATDVASGTDDDWIFSRKPAKETR